jgi:hypothetical protein
VSESALLHGSACPIFSLHYTIIRRGSAKRDSVPLNW